MFRHVAALTFSLLLFATSSTVAQREWQELAAANMQSVERGTPAYMLAMLERTSAMLNHDKEQALEFAEQALTEAKRQNDSNAEAICYLQRAVSLAEMEGIQASEQAYAQALSLFDSRTGPELRILYYAHLFYRDRLVKSADDLLITSQQLREAVDETDNQRLKFLGELNLLEQMSLANLPSDEVCNDLRDRAKSLGLNFLVLAVDGHQALKSPQPESAEALQAIATIAERAEAADFRPLHILASFHLMDAAARDADLDEFERRSDAMQAMSERHKRTDWIGLALCAKADLARARGDLQLAVERIDAAGKLLPAIDLRPWRERIQETAIKIYVAAKKYDQVVEFTNEVFTRDDHVRSRRLQQRLQEFSRELHEANQATQQEEQRAEELETRTQVLADLTGELASDRDTAQSQKNLFQRMSTIGFVLASALAGIALISRQHLRRTHDALRAEVELNERNQQIHQTLEAKIAQVQRMESLGALAGGIAHDLNNLLVGVLCNAELLDKHNCDEQMKDDCVSGIIHSALAAADLSQKMLSYAGRVPNTKRIVNINDFMNGLSPLLKSGLNLSHELKLFHGNLYANLDDTQMEQVVINLATNAAAAIEGVNGDPNKRPQVIVRTGQETIQDVSSDPTLFGTRDTGGDFVFVEFEDHGVGIAAERTARIFEPFYSSKTMGQGLGLAVVYGHVVSHNGLIRCCSAKQGGTTIRVLLPRADATTIDTEQPVAESLGTIPKQAKIVVVDDELPVLEVIRRALTAHCWEVVTFCNGAEAIHHLEKEWASYNCVVLDLCMPEMDGGEVLEALVHSSVDVPVVMMSGYSSDNLHEYRQHPQVGCTLEKPFTPAQFVDAVTRAMALHV